MRAFKDETDNIYGRLTVVHLVDGGNGKAYRWLCKCSCGNEAVVRGISLRTKSKPTRSCGCLHVESGRMRGLSKVTHGLSGSHPLYGTWCAMRRRCLREENDDWYLYGGRGVTISQEWSDFAVFVSDMGERPHGCSIDRIDNSKGYSKENCRWATAKEQRANQRPLGAGIAEFHAYQTGLQFIEALLGPRLRTHA